MINTTRRVARLVTLLCLLSVVSATFSCKQKFRHKKNVVETGFSYDEFMESLAQAIPPSDTIATDRIRPLPVELRYIYFQNDYYPIWLSHGYKADKAAEQFLAEMQEIAWDGLDTSRYNLSGILKLKNKLGRKETTLNEAIAFDTTLTHCYLAVAKDLLTGYIVPKKVDSLWFHANDSTWHVAEKLTAMQEKYSSLDEFKSKVPTYKLLRDEYKRLWTLSADSELVGAKLQIAETALPIDSAVFAAVNQVIDKEASWIKTEPNDSVSEWKQKLMAYQDYTGVRPTGKLDSATLAVLARRSDKLMPKIAANMERVRWMQQDFGSTYVMVNVPLARLFFKLDGEDAMHMNVVVGKPTRQTPSLFARMSNVVLNPQWGVPSTILKQDVLPGIQKSGADYMKKKGLKAYDRQGNVVNVTKINSSNYKRYSYRQPPGDDNALGYVKFNLPNPWDIYLHDTPHRDDFGKRDRTLSSGCIRLQRPQEMAVFILSTVEKKDFDQEKLDKIIATHKTQWLVLTNKIPVHIAYLTAFEDSTGTHVNYIRDVYHRDEKLIAGLSVK